MSWFIHGRGAQLRFHVEGRGPRHVEGTAFRHECDPLSENTTYEQCRTLSTAKLELSLYPATALEHQKGRSTLALFGLLDAVEAEPGKVHYRLRYHSSPNSWISSVIILPEYSFAQAWELLRDVLLNPQLEYLVTLGFVGFRGLAGREPYPTCQGFLSGERYLEHEADFHLRVNPPNSDLEL
jgi:hypothetical protein